MPGFNTLPSLIFSSGSFPNGYGSSVSDAPSPTPTVDVSAEQSGRELLPPPERRTELYGGGCISHPTPPHPVPLTSTTPSSWVPSLLKHLASSPSNASSPQTPGLWHSSLMLGGFGCCIVEFGSRFLQRLPRKKEAGGDQRGSLYSSGSQQETDGIFKRDN